LTFSFGPDGRYPTLSEFYHRGIRAPPCTASIGTWTDGRRSENHSRHEFRCDVSDIGLALVKAMRLYRMIYIYIFVFQFPRAFWLQYNCLPYHLTWHPLDSPTESALRTETRHPLSNWTWPRNLHEVSGACTEWEHQNSAPISVIQKCEASKSQHQ